MTVTQRCWNGFQQRRRAKRDTIQHNHNMTTTDTEGRMQ